MKRFLISGSSKFNNYYLFHKYVKEYMPKDMIMMTCGTAGGTDQMAIEYSNRNGIPLEEYPSNAKTKDDVMRRNIQIMQFCSDALIFDDGHSAATTHLKEQLLLTKKPVIVVELQDTDILDFNYTCTNEFLKSYFDMCNKSECNPFNVADVTMAIIHNEEVLKNILESKTSEYIKSESSNIAAGVARWMKQYAVSYIKQRLKHEERKVVKDSTVPLETLAKIWTEKTHPVGVFTNQDLKVLNDFVQVVADGKQLWLEANDNQVIKQSVWQTKEQLDKEEEEPVNSFYETKDSSGTRVFYRNMEFDTRPYRTGKWYFNARTLK